MIAPSAEDGSDKTALLTVGSTEFTGLVQAALSQSTLEALRKRGFRRFIVQYGKSQLPGSQSVDATAAQLKKSWAGKLDVELHGFMGDIEERMRGAELVVCHAGRHLQYHAAWL